MSNETILAWFNLFFIISQNTISSKPAKTVIWKRGILEAWHPGGAVIPTASCCGLPVCISSSLASAQQTPTAVPLFYSLFNLFVECQNISVV